jgi:hypothetical protein
VAEAGTGRAERWLLVALLAAAFALRLWVAWPNPSASRYNDERVAVETIERALRTGSLRPVSGYYLSLSYLPHLAILAPLHVGHLIAALPTAVLDEQGRLDRLGYRLCRAVQALTGTLSLWVVWRLGRRLFAAPTGLLAAFLLAVVPWHVRQSAILKPDIALVLAIALAFWAALVALERRTTWRYALAGAAVGLCLSTKFNGAAAALPLVVGTFWTGRRELGRALGRLALAGVVAAAVFAALNPYFFLDPELFRRHFFGRTLTGYAWKAKRTQSQHWEMPIEAVKSLLGSAFFGPVIGLLGALGLGGGAVPRVRSLLPYRTNESVSPVLLAVVPLGYLLAYAAVTRNPSDHNWVPLTPFVALGAAAALVAIARRAPRSVRVGALGLLGLVAVPAHRWAYREAVPATPALARAVLARALDGHPGRTVLSEVSLALDTSGWSGEGPAPGQDGPLAVPVDDLARDGGEMSVADGAIFAATRLAGPDADAYRRLMAEGVVLTLEPRFARRRGPALVMVVKPLEPAGVRILALGRGERAITIETAPESRLVSVDVGGSFRRLDEAWIESGGSRHPCVVQWRRPPGRSTCRTARFESAGDFTLRVSDGPAAAARVRVFAWRRASSGVLTDL